MFAALNSFLTGGVSPVGQQAYTSAGTYSWTCPSGVTSVSVVCVGGGGYGDYGYSPNAGGGGGLAYKNNISVTPGSSYAVVVGAEGISVSSTRGETSSFTNGVITVSASGGGNGLTVGQPSGTYDGGGSGGSGFNGAGGAGGYSGNGGNGGKSDNTSPTAGAGGGGGGGGAVYPYDASGSGGGAGGGGVGILGQGSNGTAGTNGTAGNLTVGGGGGSNGSSGSAGQSSRGGGYGGLYGGGGGWDDLGSLLPSGGAVRIIWGAGRAFPSTNTGDL
jgi:hypothetical protein